MVSKITLSFCVIGFLGVCLMASRCFADTAAQFDQADKYKDQGHYEQAEAIYKSIAKDYAGNEDGLEAQKELACLYVEADRTAEAETAYQELLKSYSDHNDIADAVDDVADAYRDVKQYGKALEIYSRVVDNWADNEQAVKSQAAIAKVHIKLGQEQATEAAVENLLADFADNNDIADAVADVADEYQDAGKYEKSIELYKHVVDTWPDSEQAMESQTGIARVYIKLGDDPAAQAAVNKLLSDFSSHPEIAEVAIEVALGYYDLERYAKYREICEHVIARPSWSGASLGSQEALVKARILIGDLPAAQAAKDKLVADFSQHRDMPKSLFRIASLYRRERKYQQARDTYQQVAQQASQPEYADKGHLCAAAMNIALLIGSGNESAAQAATDKMITDFQNRTLTLETRESYLEMMYYVGKRFQKAGKYDKAAELYRQLIQHYDENRDADRARVDLANLDIIFLIQQGDNAVAEEAIARLRVDYAGHHQLPFALAELAKTYYDKATAMAAAGSTEQHSDCLRRAAALLETVVSDFPKASFLAEKLCWAGRCYQESGEYQKSIDTYRKVIDLYPDYRFGWHALYAQGVNYESLVLSRDLDRNEADTKIKAVYERLLQRYPTCRVAGEVQEWIDQYNSRD